MLYLLSFLCFLLLYVDACIFGRAVTSCRLHEPVSLWKDLPLWGWRLQGQFLGRGCSNSGTSKDSSVLSLCSSVSWGWCWQRLECSSVANAVDVCSDSDNCWLFWWWWLLRFSQSLFLPLEKLWLRGSFLALVLPCMLIWGGGGSSVWWVALLSDGQPQSWGLKSWARVED